MQTKTLYMGNFQIFTLIQHDYTTGDMKKSLKSTLVGTIYAKMSRPYLIKNQEAPNTARSTTHFPIPQ